MAMLKGTFSSISRSLLHNWRNESVQRFRRYSAWIGSSSLLQSKEQQKDEINVEKLFTDKDVQQLLKEMTGMDLEGKIFAARPIELQQRSHYALMTDEMFQKTLERMQGDAKYFLQFVPVKEPRPEGFTVISRDPDIEGFDQSKFVFTDISFDATDQDRTVVVRETDGVLRMATPEEHDRMNRVYYEQPNRPISEPPLFSDPHLQDILDRDEHEFLLDYACYFYEPDDPSFVKLCRTVFDRTVKNEKIALLHSTRHFGPFAFYLALNDNIPPLLNYFGSVGSLSNAAKLIRLQRAVHRDWRHAIASGDDDKKIVQDYINQNLQYKSKLADLIDLMNGKQRKPVEPRIQPKSEKASAQRINTLDEQAVRSKKGPLGEMADEYTVRIARSSYSADNATTQQNEEPRKRRSRSIKRRPHNSDPNVS